MPVAEIARFEGGEASDYPSTTSESLETLRRQAAVKQRVLARAIRSTKTTSALTVPMNGANGSTHAEASPAAIAGEQFLEGLVYRKSPSLSVS